MSKTVALLGVGTLAFGSASAYLMHELGESRAHAQALQARITELETASPPDPFRARRMPPAQVPASAPGEPASMRSAPVAASRSPEPALAAAQEPPALISGRQDVRGAMQDLLKDPEYRKAMLLQQRASLLRMYPDLRTALGLQDSQADALLDALAEQQLAMTANPPPFRRNGSADQDAVQQWQKQQQELQRQRDAQLAAILGESKLQAWKEYQTTLGARMQIRELRTELAESGAPLREDQVQPLVAAIAAEQQRRSQELQSDPASRSGARVLTANGVVITGGNRVEMLERSLENTAQYNQRLHDAAAPYLSSDQLKSFDRVLSQQLEMQRANLVMMRIQQERAPRGNLGRQGGSEVAFSSSAATQ